MGLMKCEIHGETGVISYVSKDLCKLILKKEKTIPSKIKSIHAVFFDEGEMLFDRFYFFSSDLFDSLSLKEEYKIISDEDESNFNNLIRKHLGSICVNCFKDYMRDIGYNYSL